MVDVFFHKWSFHRLFDKLPDATMWLAEIKSGAFAFDPSTSDLGSCVQKNEMLQIKIYNL